MQNILRYSMKAIIIKNGKLLVERCDYGRGRFSKLPGGGQEWGETMEQALIRECQEEICINVQPKRLVLIRDYIAKNHNTKFDDANFHQVELMFECDVADISALGCGIKPDGDDQEAVWISLDELDQSDFMPRAVIPYLKNLGNIQGTINLGDVN